MVLLYLLKPISAANKTKFKRTDMTIINDFLFIML